MTRHVRTPGAKTPTGVSRSANILSYLAQLNVPINIIVFISDIMAAMGDKKEHKWNKVQCMVRFKVLLTIIIYVFSTK